MNDIIITGNLSRMALGKVVFDKFSELYGVRFVIPDKSEFATALGACLFGLKSNQFKNQVEC